MDRASIKRSDKSVVRPKRIARAIGGSAVVGLFCLPAVGLVANAVMQTDRVSETERRTLAELPSYEGDPRAYTSGLDTFLEDNFGYRMQFIRFARKLRDNLGEDPSTVATGRDGWLFLNQHHYRDEFEGQGQWSEADVQAWVETFESARLKLSSEGIAFAAMVAVDKARLYPEYVPDDWTEGLPRFRTRLHAAAEGRDTGLVDVEPYLLEAKREGLKVFYQRDTHWTPIGTHSLSMAVLDELDPQATRPRYAPGPPRLSRPERLLDLDSMSGYSASQEPEALTISMPAPGPDGVISLEADGEASPRHGSFATIRMDGAPDAPDGRLVVIGDSFADTILPHFLPAYSEIVRLHNGAHLFETTLDEALAYQPTAILFVTAERQAVGKKAPFVMSGPSDEIAG